MKKRLASHKKTTESQTHVPTAIEQTPDEKVLIRIVDKFVDLCVRNGLTIFGSYVREYMSRRPFDPSASDIDVFTNVLNFSKFFKLVSDAGFYIEQNPTKANRYSQTEKIFSVTHFTVGMINDEFFIGKKLSFQVDYVIGSRKTSPPFNCLEFSCNAWIWDSHGIRLSKQTGTHFDTLSARDIKDYEQTLLEECKNKIATYFPLDNPDTLRSMDGLMISRRKSRIERIDKLLRNGWTLGGVSNISQVLPESEDICLVCQESITEPCVKLSCCTSKYHNDCFVKYGHSELEERTVVRCMQRCSELEL